MNKMILVLVGILSLNQALAAPVFRPYISCISTSHATNIEIMQNMDSQDASNPYKISVVRSIKGNKVSMMNQNAVKAPVQTKNDLEIFQNFSDQSAYSFELVISKNSPINMMGQYKSKFTDMLGHSVVYCSYHVTFEN